MAYQICAECGGNYTADTETSRFCSWECTQNNTKRCRTKAMKTRDIFTTTPQSSDDQAKKFWDKQQENWK